jgi:hypothetical protein
VLSQKPKRGLLRNAAVEAPCPRASARVIAYALCSLICMRETWNNVGVAAYITLVALIHLNRRQ